MRAIGVFIVFIFSICVSPADEVDNFIISGEYSNAYSKLKQTYGNDAARPEYLFISGIDELSGENSVAYLKDFINKSSPDSHVRDWAKLIIGKYYLAQRLYVTARKQLESIPDNSPLGPEAKYLIGRSYLLSGEYRPAVDIFEQSIDYIADNDFNPAMKQGRVYGYWASLGLADSYLALADYSKAENQYQKLILPELNDDIYALALLGLSETAAKQGKRDSAERYNKLYHERYQTAIEPSIKKQPVQAAVPDKKPAESSGTATHIYYIQVGVFSEQDNAIRTSSLYKNSGYDVYMENYTAGGKKYYRILIGGYNSKQQAEFIKNRLEKASGEKLLLIKR